MKNKAPVFYYLLLMIVLMALSQPSFAQKEDENESADSISGPPAEYKIDDAYADTVIKRTLINESDSVLKWRQNKEFAYMKYLDSMLKSRSDIRSDTVTIGDRAGKVKRKKPADNAAMNRFLNSLPIRIFFWTLALFFIGFIFYKIFFKNGIFDGLKSRKRRNEDEEDSVESLGEFSEYDALIAEAESNNNFNLSSRYLYLKTLKSLYDKGLINFSPDKTNGEYLQEMSSHPYHGQFVALTRNYEYAWYGTFLISEAQYKKLKRQFIEFNKKISI
jgi:Domain of unknown function (DUF4129)